MSKQNGIQNQVNLPRNGQAKRKGKWNDRPGWKIFFKKNGNSMLLFSGLTGYNAILRRNTLKRIYSDWKGHFIITK